MKNLLMDNLLIFYDENDNEVTKFFLEFDDEGDYVLATVFTPPYFRGQGFAGKAMDAFIIRLKEENKKFVPMCSYAKAYVEKNPDVASFVKI